MLNFRFIIFTQFVDFVKAFHLVRFTVDRPAEGIWWQYDTAKEGKWKEAWNYNVNSASSC